jgi:glycosyltransferase involved in cell wall biosynthesis
MDKDINTTNTPNVSIIIPAFNREPFISESIESALKQTFSDFEIIVIDDGSTDKTVEVAQKYSDDHRVNIMRNEKNLGIANTRNKAVRMARGKYIAMLDSDDVWIDKNKLQKQFDFLESNPNYALVGSNMVHIDVKGEKIKEVIFPINDITIRKTILRRNPFAQSTILCRKEAMENAGLYSTRFTICDDYDLWLKIGRDWKFANINESMTGYRIHGNNITHKKRLKAASEVLEIVRMHKDNYPNATMGIIKAYMRLILAYARS